VWLRQLSPTPTEILLKTTTLNFQSALRNLPFHHTIKDAGTTVPSREDTSNLPVLQILRISLVVDDMVGKLQGNAPKRDASMTLDLYPHNS
jgi:hypothetical protein